MAKIRALNRGVLDCHSLYDRGLPRCERWSRQTQVDQPQAVARQSGPRGLSRKVACRIEYESQRSDQIVLTNVGHADVVGDCARQTIRPCCLEIDVHVSGEVADREE